MTASHWRSAATGLGIGLAVAAIVTENRWVTWCAIVALASALALRLYARRQQE